MKILACVKIPAIYSAIGVNQKLKTNRYTNDYESNHILYHCLKCGADFSIHHRYATGFQSWSGVDDSHLFRCPVCGNTHESFRGRNNICLSGDWVPASMVLRVKELRDEIVLEVDADSRKLLDSHDLRVTQHEQFRFNVKARKTLFCRWQGKGTDEKQVLELGAPFADVVYFSILQHLRGDNLSKEHRPEILGLMRILRQAIQQRWEQVHGYPLKNTYVSYGRQNGFMCFPLLNLAYRLVFPDCDSLPAWLNGSPTERTTESFRRYYENDINGAGIFNDLPWIRRAKNSLDPIIKYYGLPDTPMVRQELTRDVFAAAILGRIYTAVQDQNHLFAIYNDLRGLVDCWETGYDATTLRKLTDDILRATVGRNGTEIRGFIQYVRKNGSYYLRDIVHMLAEAPKFVREASAGVKMKNLHDWLVNEKRKVEEKGYPLDVPEHVVRRLQMQMDSVKFYIPGHSRELVQGSEAFKNCVRTYGKRVLSGQCYIAFMTDDKGRLTACLEVQGDDLVQAKLRYNRPVKENSAVNGAVVDWCHETGLKIRTGDVRKMRYPVPAEVAV